MRDLAENLGIIATHRAAIRYDSVENSRACGVHNTAGEIDLADYNYPRVLLVCLNIGELGKNTALDLKILSGLLSGALTNTDYTMPQKTTVGEWVYEYHTTRRFFNIECTITDPGQLGLAYSVVLVTDHARYGNMGSDD